MGDPPGERARSRGPSEDWEEILSLLSAGRYRPAASRIQEKQAEGGDNSVLSQSLAAARHLCLTCHQYREEIEAHRQSLADATQREQALRQRIVSLLALASGEELVDPDAEMEVGSLQEGVRPEPALVETERRPGWWERIQGLLGRGKWPPSSAAERAGTLRSEPIGEGSRAAEKGAVASMKTDLTSTSPENEEARVQDGAALTVYTLGMFRVYQDEQRIDEWSSLKGQSIFKYLITQRERPVHKEVLMELFWPDADPDSARNNLNVAIYGLRQAFRQKQPDLSYVLFRDDSYLLNPELHIWVDLEEFRRRFIKAKQLEQRGEHALATAEYHVAEALYQGEFLEEDRYEDWLLPLRRQLRDDYLDAVDTLSHYYFDLEDYGACITLCSKILDVDRCREQAHRLYMRCCSRQGQRYLALRQYYRCIEALEDELEAKPSESTAELYEKIRQGQTV